MIEWINQIGNAWLSYFGLMLVQNSIFLMIILLTLVCLRKISARIRYRLALLGLLKLILPPLIPIELSGQLPEFTVQFTNLAKYPAVTQSTEIALSLTPKLNGSAFLFLFWGLMVVIGVGFILKSAWCLHQSIRRSRYLFSVKYQRKNIAVFENTQIQMPLTTGLFSPKILVPRQWHDWPKACREMVINHELSHIKRYDNWIQLLQTIVRAIYWFHPLVWYLNHQLNETREMACDELTIGNAKHASIIYSRYLIQIAEGLIHSRMGYSSASALIRQKNSLIKRVQYLLKEAPMQSISKVKTRLLFWGFLLMIPAFSWHFSQGFSKEAVPNKIAIQVSDQEKVTVNDEIVALEQLESHLKKIIRDDKQKKVITLDIDESIPMGMIHKKIQETLTNLDLVNVSYRMKEKEPVMLTLPTKELGDKFSQIPKKNRLGVLINENGEILFDQKPVQLSEVENMTRKALRLNPYIIIDIMTSENARYENFINVLEEIKQAGAKRIMVQGQSKRKVPK